MNITREDFTTKQYKELEAICKSIRGVEFIFQSDTDTIFKGRAFNAYVAAAEPLIGITIKPSEPDAEFNALPLKRQYLMCLVAQNCMDVSIVLKNFRQYGEVLCKARPEDILTFGKIVG